MRGEVGGLRIEVGVETLVSFLEVPLIFKNRWKLLGIFDLNAENRKLITEN